MPHDLLGSETNEKIPVVKNTRKTDNQRCFLSLPPQPPEKSSYYRHKSKVKMVICLTNGRRFSAPLGGSGGVQRAGECL